MVVINKKYSAINRQSYLVSINLPENKGQINIDFKSGYGRDGNAFFFSNDLLIQEALEKDHRFGKAFKLELIDGMPIEEYEARKSLGSNGKQDGNGGGLELKEFEDINAAKDFLKSEPHNIEGKKIPNFASVINKGKALGFDIVIKPNN